MHWVSRSLPKGVRPRRARRPRSRGARGGADVVYTTGMFGRSAAGATLARRPYVVKLTADPAFERARRRGMVGGDVDEFQRSRGGARVRALRLARDARAAPRGPRLHAERLPRASWPSPGACRPERVSVLPNPSPPLPELRPRDELRGELGLDGADARLRGPADRAEVARRRARGGRRERRRRAADRRRGRRARAARAARRGARARRPRPLPRRRSRASACSSCSAPPTRRSSRRAGRTSRTRWSRRSPSGRRCSRRRSAASPRSCATARTGCSSRPGDRRRARRRRSAASSPTASCASGCAPPRRRRSPTTRRERVFGRLEETLVRVARTAE